MDVKIYTDLMVFQLRELLTTPGEVENVYVSSKVTYDSSASIRTSKAELLRQIEGLDDYDYTTAFIDEDGDVFVG